MAKVELSPTALEDFRQQVDFLLEMSPNDDAPEQFSALIREGINRLIDNPFIAGYFSIGGDFRELTLLANKKRGYRLLYLYNKAEDLVTILAIKDARQLSFTGY